MPNEAKLIEQRAGGPEPHYEPFGWHHWPQHPWMSYQFRRGLGETQEGGRSVSEVYRLSHRTGCEALMQEYAGRAAIGHVRYATCGADDRGYAQPFERHHLIKYKWFSFALNGQLANYQELRNRVLSDADHHLLSFERSGSRFHRRNHQRQSGQFCFCFYAIWNRSFWG